MNSFESNKYSPIENSGGGNPEQEKLPPEIKFGLSKESDINIFLMFWKAGKSVHPDLDYLLEIKDEEQVRKEVEKFVDQFYKSEESGIAEKFQAGQQEWQNLAPIFFDKVNKFFHGYAWPQIPNKENRDQYEAWGTIWHTYPRQINNQRFAVPVNPKFNTPNMPSVVAHEMLHFITYDYLQKKYGLKSSEAGDADNTFWQFTETLNALIEEDEMWQEFMYNGRQPDRKPECEEMYKKMKPIWDQNKDIDNLVRQIFNVS